MNPITASANVLWVASNLPAAVRFRRALRCPAATQRRLLDRALARDANCAYGRAHGFSGIRTYEEFARRVPLADYADQEPWIDRIVGGEEHVLTWEPVTHLVPTSGSTGPRKLIPFTAGLQREFNAAIGPWVADLYSRLPSIALGPAYWSVTPVLTSQNPETSALPIGFDEDTSYLGSGRKRCVDAVMAVPSELRFVKELDAFRYVTLLCLLGWRDLRLVSVWHPSFLNLLLDALPRYWDRLLADIRTGQCLHSEALPTATRDAVKFGPMPRRAKELEGADPRKPEMLWPFLKVISCWGDGPAEFASAELQRRFPRTLFQSKGLLATEAFVTIPFAGMRPVAVCSHFFEFLDEQGRTHLTHELRRHESYEVVVTTAGGLWRYRLGDRVQVTGFLGQTPSLRFLGKSGNVSDRFGEKLSEAFVAVAVQEALATLPATPRFVLLAPDEDAVGWHYTLYLDGETTPLPVERLEALLRKNPHYAYCRELGQLQPLRAFRIHGRGYEIFLARETSRGRREGEIKPCFLSRDAGWSQYFAGEYENCEPRPTAIKAASRAAGHETAT